VELHRDLLPGRLSKSDVQKRVQERLVDEARMARSGDPPVFVERFFGPTSRYASFLAGIRLQVTGILLMPEARCL
jgi:hypothetical protein